MYKKPEPKRPNFRKDEKTREQRDCFAVKACHMMGKTVEETSKLLNMSETEVKVVYRFIEKDMIDFDNGF